MTNKLFTDEHEKAVISILLKNPGLYYSIPVRAHMMSSMPNQLLFREIELLNERQLVADLNLVFLGCKWLRQQHLVY